MSYGIPTPTRPEMDALSRACARGVLPVAAMGNDRARNTALAPCWAAPQACPGGGASG
jgi:hypothetical protein